MKGSQLDLALARLKQTLLDLRSVVHHWRKPLLYLITAQLVEMLLNTRLKSRCLTFFFDLFRRCDIVLLARTEATAG